MKRILIALAVLPLLSCAKDFTEEATLTGKWNLLKTELYVNDSLSGTIISDEITTTYLFRGNDSGELIISEDGDEQAYNYIMNKETKSIILSESKAFNIELLNQKDLQLASVYEPYMSVYTFSKNN